ncbi:helix-turn-helix domain-containing protein [Kutzneria kofuensis]|uniref:Transcriptional regulator with XRE-family HTH domain n=1 Tax=Kutzneria kofuensis TaxID=103725 RepID=A0A7W9KC86_9PSEU|nr:helix-turn-helix transcriptional regulator [Kutzneria kofuensis]MBB5889856.1 transcriptional regulator with XRE-family HTH domain [Kutzneria kofuensis]
MEDRPIPELISDLIKRARMERGLSQTGLAMTLADVSGQDTVTRSEVSRWERGKRIPTRHWLRWLAVVLGVPLERLECAATFSRRFRTVKSVADVLPMVGHGSAEPGAIPRQTANDDAINLEHDRGTFPTPGAK